ncbi:MAG: polyprenyl synthetase family protein [Nitrospirota bacterium]
MKIDYEKYPVAAIPINDVWEIYRPYLKLIEEDIRRNLDSISPLTKEIAFYIFDSGGKRIRPLLTIISSKLCGYSGEDDITLATIVEYIHTATLLHDDVIDNSEIRRGRDAARTLWGNQASILVGDFLYTKAMCKVVDIQNQDINRLISDTCRKLSEGEIIQLSYSGDTDLTEEEYLRIIEYKTGALISMTCALGGIIADLSSREKDALTEFGLNLGIAFQVADDTLDYVANKDKLGKSLGSDLQNGKITLPILHLLKYCVDNERQNIKDIIKNSYDSKENLFYILELMNRYGSIEYSLDLARSFSERAKENIAIFDNSLHKSSILALADYMVSRDH